VKFLILCLIFGTELISIFFYYLQSLSDASQPCVLRSVSDGAGGTTLECVPVSNSAPAPMSLADESLFALTRVPFSEVPASSLYLSESMTNLNYDMDYASLNTRPFVLAQMAIRNYSPFEQFITVKAAKRYFRSQTFTFAVEIRPVSQIVLSNFAAFVQQTAQNITNTLLAPIISFVDMIIPGISGILPNVTVPAIGLDLLPLELPIGFRSA